jgi:hypothetical protein
LIGIPLLHHQWAFDSIRTQVLQPFEKYFLPSGSSVLHPYYVFSTTYGHQNGPTNNVYQDDDDDDDDGYVSHQRHHNNQNYSHKNKIPFQIIPNAIATIGILDGLRILNLAGELWDSVLITAGATVIHSTNALLHNMQYCVDSSNSNKNDHDDHRNNTNRQQHHHQHSSYQKSSSSLSSISNIDIILIDPYEYVISYHIYNYNCNDKNTSNILSTLSSTLNVNSRLINSDPLLTISSNNSSNNNNNNNNSSRNSTSSSYSGKKHHIERPIVQSKLSDIELITTYKCFHYHNQIQPPPPQQQQQQHNHVSHMIPFVASTDWLIHCLSLNEVIDIDYSDVFTLPLSPITHPYTFKTQTNERISKYDIVYFKLYKNTKKNYDNGSNIQNSNSNDKNKNINNNSRSNGTCDSLVNSLINCGSGNNKNSKNNTNFISRKSFKYVNDNDNSKDNMKDSGDDIDVDIVYIGKIIDFSRATFNQSLKCKILPYCKCSSRYDNSSNDHDHDDYGSDDYCDPEKQLRIDSNSGIVIINAQQIISKIIVLSKEAYQSLYTYCKNDDDVYYVDKDVDDYYYHNYKNCYNFYNRKNNDSIDNHEKNNNNIDDDDDVMIKKTKKHSQYYSKMSQDY